jgi:hypothetical protein
VPALQLPATTLPRPVDGGKLWGDGFEIETMINIRAAVDGMKVGEVASVEHARIHGETNLNTFRDGFRVLRTIFSEYGRMRRRRTIARRGTDVIVHQRRPAVPRTAELIDVVNRNTPAASAHPTDVRPHLNHLNRAVRRDDTAARRLQAAVED